MEDLPSAIVVEILSRVNDSCDLASCRLVSRTLRSLSYDVRAINIVCSHSRFARSRAPETRSSVVPFKSIVCNLVSLLRCRNLESICLAVEESFVDGSCEFDESDDLHLTATDFVSCWLPGIGGELKSLSISDLWLQSCWRQSDVLPLISKYCDKLLSLEVRKAWLSVENLKPMTELTSLTLEIIRLDDEDLEKVNACFPSLKHLNLIGVGGLKQPTINLRRLKTCYWKLSQVPFSIAVHAPELSDLDLVCVSPRVISLQTPSLLRLRIKLKQVGHLQVDKFLYLRSLCLDSVSGFENLLRSLSASEDTRSEAAEVDLTSSFPNLEELELLPGAWRDFASISDGFLLPGSRRLRRLTLHLEEISMILASSISAVVAACGRPDVVSVILHGTHSEEDVAAMNRLLSECANSFPKVKWRWLAGASLTN